MVHLHSNDDNDIFRKLNNDQTYQRNVVRDLLFFVNCTLTELFLFLLLIVIIEYQTREVSMYVVGVLSTYLRISSIDSRGLFETTHIFSPFHNYCSNSIIRRFEGIVCNI